MPDAPNNGLTGINFISQWYAPEPVSVPVLTAAALRDSGFRVHVLTGIPNLPDGRTYCGYKAWQRRLETWQDIDLTRTPLYPNHSTSALKRMLNYLSWAVSATLFGMSRLRRADVNVVHCTPATAAIPALVVKLLFGVPYVIIIQDLWPDTVAASGFLKSRWITRLVLRALDLIVACIYRGANRVVVISPGMKESLERRGIAAKKLRLIYNSVDEDVYRPRADDGRVRLELGVDEEEFLIVYAGNQGAAQDLSPLVKALGLLRSDCRARLVVAGWGVQHDLLVDLAASSAPNRVSFIGRITPAEVRRVQSAADLCVVSLKDDPLFRITMPSKLQALLASGLPILGIVAGDVADIITEAKAGIVAAPGDPQGIAEAITEAIAVVVETRKAWGTAGREYYARTMASDIRMKKLGEVVNEVVHGRSGRTRASKRLHRAVPREAS